MAQIARRTGWLALAAVVMGGTAVQAQRRPDMVLTKHVGTVDDARAARIALVNGVQCLLDERPSNVRAFLGMYPDSKDGVRAATYLNAGDCVDGQAGSQTKMFGPAMLRGAIYKVMYQRAFAAAPGQLRGSADFAGDVAGQSAPTTAEYVASRKFAECMVRRDPATTRALVLAPVESEDEMAALRKLVPTYDACVQPGQPKLTRAGLTGVVAEVLYRLSEPESGKNA